MSIEGTYPVTRSDLYEAQVRHAGWLFWAFQAIGVLLFCAGLLTFALRQYTQAIIPIALGTLFLLRMRLTVRSIYRRDFVPAVETTITVSDTGVVFENEKGRSELQWNAFVSYIETNTIFLLYVQSRIFQMVPKRAFGTDDLEVLRSLLQRKVVRISGVGGRDPRVLLFGIILVIAFILVVWAVHTTKSIQ
jgi:uncharacterized membrane protein (UPF0136 family)